VATVEVCASRHAGLPPLPGAISDHGENVLTPSYWDAGRQPSVHRPVTMQSELKHGQSIVQFQNSGIDAAIVRQDQGRIKMHANSNDKPSNQSSSRKRSRFKCFFSGLWRSKNSEGE
jgi:hypothetical protein